MSTLLRNNIHISYQNLIKLLFSIICIFITRQFPLSEYSFISNIALVGIIAFRFPKDKLYYLFVSILTCLTVYSLINNNSISNILRFYIILSVIGAAYYIKTPITIINVLYTIIILHCIIILGLELYMLFGVGHETANIIRHTFISNGWGDIYSPDGIYYRIQLKGNGILPFVYMLTYTYLPYSKVRQYLFRFLLLISIVLSGHFAFLVIIAIYHIYNYILNKKTKAQTKIIRIYIFLAISLIIYSFIYNYVLIILEQKADYSTPTRFDQFNVLINDVSSNIISLFCGSGLGHTINVITQYRDYTDMVYYELQIIYIFNQLGLVFFTLLIVYLLYLTIKRIQYKDLLYVYIFYIIYAASNPYIFDTNHFVVILTLCCISDYRINNKYNSYLH